jgi:SanA protein
MTNDASSCAQKSQSMPPRKSLRARLTSALLLLIAIPTAPLATANLWILLSATGRTTSKIEDIPNNSTILVLGTAPKQRNHQPNPFFEGRMDATATLYHAGKAGRIILSGDRRRPEYNEPLAMRDALVKRGIPVNALEMDNEGARTLLSLRNAKQTYQLREIVTVTDDFHQPRCLFLARHFGINAQGFIGPSIPWRLSLKTRLREIPSRLKALSETLLPQLGATSPPSASGSHKANRSSRA